jgi:hypothetical protein
MSRFMPERGGMEWGKVDFPAAKCGVLNKERSG